MLVLDELVDRMVTALGENNPVTGFFDDVQPMELGQELDPVARIGGEAALEEESEFPSVFADPLDSPVDIDAMTTSLRERDVARETFKKQTPGSSASFQSAQAATGLPQPTTRQFVNRMLAKEGMEYEWGGTTAATGFDCSGIIYRIMQNFGFANFPRVSGDIIAHAKPISVKKAINTRGAVLWTEGHIAVSLGNGKTIEARGEDYGVVSATAHGRFTKGGLLPELQQVAGGGGRKRNRTKGQGRLVFSQPKPENPSLESVISPVAVFGGLMDEAEAPVLKMRGKTDVPKRGLFGQLYEGFMDAGRPDLAKMVFTKDFKTWLSAETSTYDVGNVSKPYDGIRNYGLFQFRNLEGRDWLTQYIKGGKFTASAYQQAQLVAQYFDLTVDDIHRYADEVRADTYGGWG